MKVKYGNWISLKKTWRQLILSGLLVFVFVISFLGFARMASPVFLWGVRIAILAALAVLLYRAGYMLLCYRALSYKGRAKMQAKILEYVLQHLNFKEGEILDIGCGSGALAIKTAQKFKNAQITGIDYWGEGWGYAKKQCEENAKAEGVTQHIQFIKGDAGHMEFDEGRFDAAISNFVFHEVQSCPNRRDAVKEALRVVKKGGSFAFHDLFLKENLYGNMEEMVEELRKEGIEKIDWKPSANEIGLPRILKTKRMLGQIAIVYGTK